MTSQQLVIKDLTAQEKREVAKVRSEIIERLRNTPKSGVEVEYFGKNFLVTAGVFWPRPDSVPLVENFKINQGDEVLDVCTGSGVIGIFAALNAAKKVVAVDINPDAIDVVKINAKRHGVENIVEARVSDIFSSVGQDEKFDVITCNPPFTDELPDKDDMASKTLRDPGLRVTKAFFKHVGEHLRPGGRVYISQANSGNVHEMLKLAEEAGFGVKMIGKKEMPENSLEFYAFELLKQRI